MDHHPRRRRRTTTTITIGLLSKSAAHFLAAPFLFLLLAFLPFSFRHSLHAGTNLLSAYLHRREPSLPSLLARLSLPPDPPPRPRPRPFPLLHLTRPVTLSDPDAAVPHRPANSSSFPASFPLPAPAPLRLLARSPAFVFLATYNSSAAALPTHASNDSDKSRLWPGLDLNLDPGDAAELLFLLTLLSAAYGWVILGFLFTYCFTLGPVFLVVSNSVLERNRLGYESRVRAGGRLGVRRLLGFLLLRWAVRDAFTQLLGIWFFKDVEDQYTVFKLFLQLKMLPFSATSSAPLIGKVRFDVDLYWFVLLWIAVDTSVGMLFSVNCWVTIMDSRRSGVEIIREGWYYLNIMLRQAWKIKCLESICCGALAKWIVEQIAGDVFALYVQSVGEVFFMVVWLVYYFAARAKDVTLGGRSFGRRELEEAIRGV